MSYVSQPPQSHPIPVHPTRPNSTRPKSTRPAAVFALVSGLTLLFLVPTLAVCQVTPDALEITEDSAAPFGPSVAEGEFGLAQIAADFDGDGYDDLAVARNKDAFEGNGGLTYVLRGGPGGLAYSQTLAPPQIIGLQTQDFGTSLASCDLDGDGFADLIVGAPGAEVAGDQSAGVIFIYLGGESGLSLSQVLSQDDLSLTSQPDEAFGFSLAAGDFDGNQTCDLAVGSPREDEDTSRGATLNVGTVTILYGLGNGSMSTSAALSFQEPDVPTTQLPGLSRQFDNFGYSLSTVPGGDSSGDGLLVGVPGKDEGATDRVGRVWLINFNGQALQASSFIGFSDGGSVSGTPNGFERFGHDLANGVFENGARHAAIGAPGTDLGAVSRAGAVFLVPLDDFGQPSISFARLDQSLSAFGSGPNPNEEFGKVVSVNDVNRDGEDDLLVSAPGDLHESTRGSGPAASGAVHVLMHGSSSSVLNRFGSDLANEFRDFGASFSAGNFYGDGSASLVVGAPSTNLPAARGFGPNDNHGALYLYRSTVQAPLVTLVVRTEDQPDGSVLSELSDAAVTSAGIPGYRARFTFPGMSPEETRLFVDGIQVQSQLDVECAEGENLAAGLALDSPSSFAYFDRTASTCASLPIFERGIVGPGGFVATQSTVISGGSVGFGTAPVSTTEGRQYFLGTDFLGTERILRTAIGSTGPITIVASEGDSLGNGVFVKSIDHFDVSDAGGRVIYSGNTGAIADVGGVMLDGVRVLVEGAFFPQSASARLGAPLGVQQFTHVAVDEAARHLVALRDDQNANHWVTYGSGGVLLDAVGETMAVGGQSLSGLQPLALAISDDIGIHLWGRAIEVRGSTSMPTGDLLLAACNGRVSASDVVLARGQAVDIDGGAPATVLGIYAPPSSAGLEPTDDRRVFLRAALTRGSDSFDAIIGVDIICSGIFSDDFESGSVGAWSSASP